MAEAEVAIAPDEAPPDAPSGPRRRRWPRRIAAAALLLGLSLWLAPKALYRLPASVGPDTLATVEAGALRAEGLRVLVWNIQKGSQPPFPEVFPRFAEGADLVLVEEAWTEDAAMRPLLDTGLGWSMARSWIARWSGAVTGVATGARVAPTAPPDAFRSPGREPIIRTPKTSLVSRYRIGGPERGAELLVVNAHCILVRSPEALAEQLVPLEAVIAAHRGPVILAGDFNTWNTGRIAVLEDLVRRQRLAQVFPIAPGAGGDARKSHDGCPLDHAFVRGLIASNAEVLVTDASDHNALRFEVTLP